MFIHDGVQKHLQEVIQEDCYPVECLIWELSQMDSLVDRIVFLKQFISDMNTGIIKMLIDERLGNERPPEYLIPLGAKEYNLARLWNEHMERMYEALKQFAVNRARRLIKEYTSILNEKIRLNSQQAERTVLKDLESDEVVDYAGAMKVLDVSLKTVYDYKYRGLIKPVSPEGTRPLFRKSELIAFKHGII